MHKICIVDALKQVCVEIGLVAEHYIPCARHSGGIAACIKPLSHHSLHLSVYLPSNGKLTVPTVACHMAFYPHQQISNISQRIKSHCISDQIFHNKYIWLHIRVLEMLYSIRFWWRWFCSLSVIYATFRLDDRVTFLSNSKWAKWKWQEPTWQRWLYDGVVSLLQGLYLPLSSIITLWHSGILPISVLISCRCFLLSDLFWLFADASPDCWLSVEIQLIQRRKGIASMRQQQIQSCVNSIMLSASQIMIQQGWLLLKGSTACLRQERGGRGVVAQK